MKIYEKGTRSGYFPFSLRWERNVYIAMSQQERGAQFAAEGATATAGLSPPGSIMVANHMSKNSSHYTQF